jgi:hypothetical protein
MSPTFKVATGSHQNEYGFTTYAEALDDVSIFKPEFALGCFGLKVTSPTEGSTVKQGTHVSIVLNKDSASQTTLLNQVDIYKVKEGTDELVVTIWKGTERIPKVFVLKDQLRIPEEQYDPNASYFYKLDVTGKRKDDKCTFQSGAFKITA